MSLSTQLRERNAELAENAREKLKNECIKFTEYNKGATTVDLMMDWIWRPKGQRRSPWGLIDDFILHDNVNRVDFAVLHAYRFGQALIFYWDEKNRSVCLIGCEYNFRRGRCLGSYERNGKALARISALMAKSQLLLKRNPGRAVETKEKLRDECIKFNHYNKGATKMDLMTDAIWRPRSQRRFPWALFVKGLHQIFRSPIYPLDSSLNHAYEFTKAFETRGPDENHKAIVKLVPYLNNMHAMKGRPDLPFNYHPCSVITKDGGSMFLPNIFSSFLRLLLTNSTVQEVCIS
ncbi:unnamed protein product, partial [Mesorhabditis spiculigera]